MTSPGRSGLARRSFCVALALGACKRHRAAGATRVVSLSPSTSEAMFAIAAGALLVGRSQHCDYPEEVKRLPSVGGYADPDFERVMALAPTLVIGEQGPAGPGIDERLRAHGIATFFPPTRTVAEIGELLVALADRVGRAGEGRRAKATMDAAVARVAAWAKRRPSVRVVMVFDARPLIVAGPAGFPDELIRLAGGQNAIDGGGGYPTIDIERMLALDPEVILDAGDDLPGRSRLADNEGWSHVRAVKNGKVRKIGSAAALRPGPRIAEGIAAIARAIHGADPGE